MDDFVMDDFVVIGRVVSVQPARRSVCIRAASSRKAELQEPAWLHIRMRDGVRRCKVESTESRQSDVKVELAPTVPRDWIASMRNAEIVVPASEALPRSNTDYDVDELDGLEVRSGESRVGYVAGCVKTPAGGVLEVERTGGGSVLVPAVAEVIDRVDWDSGQIWIGDTAYLEADDQLAT